MSRKRGDVINNGKVGTLDAVYMLGHIAGLPTFQLNDQESLRAADVSAGGNSLQLSDVTHLLNNLVGNTGYDISSLFTYEFKRNGNSTVNHSGQTNRLGMAKQIHSAFSDTSNNRDKLERMLKNDSSPFSNNTFNNSGKKIFEKLGYNTNGENTVIQGDFDDYLDEFKEVRDYNQTNSTNVWAYSTTDTASSGVPGVLTYVDDEGNTKNRKVNKKGFEINQKVTKSFIGALSANNAMNYYLTKELLDVQTNDRENPRSDNSTEMEHKWDEAFGYCLDPSKDDDGEDNDILLHKYIDQTGKHDVFEQAFYRGREAISNEDYDKRDRQANIIKELIADVLIKKAKDYVDHAKDDLVESNDTFTEHIAHDLSEGYGFIYSLQFIKDVPGKSYTKSAVDAMLAKLTNGNGLWDVTAAICQEILDLIGGDDDDHDGHTDHDHGDDDHADDDHSDHSDDDHSDHSDDESASQLPVLIKVANGDRNNDPYYTFYDKNDQVIPVNSSTGSIELDINKSYKFVRKGQVTSHPFYIKTDPASNKINITGDDSTGFGIRGPQGFLLNFNGLTTSDTLNYYCSAHPGMNKDFALTDSSA